MPRPPQHNPRRAVAFEDGLRLALVAAAALLPFVAGKLDDAQTGAIALLLGAIALASLTRALRRRAEGTGRDPADLLLGAFVLLQAISVLWAPYRHGAFLAVVLLLCYALCLWLSRDLLSASAWPGRLLAVVVAAGAVVSVLGLREYLLTVRTTGELGWRIFVTFYNPNLVAGYLLLSLPAAAVLAVRFWRPREGGSPAVRPLALTALVLMIVALPLTGSKGGALGALAAAVVLGLTLAPPGTDWGRRLRRGTALVVLIGLLLGMSLPPTRTRLLAAFSTESHSIAFRYYTWRGMVEMIRARPLTGFGAGSFEWAYPAYAQAGFTRLGHQSHLQVATETGLPGLTLYLLLWAALARGLLRRLARAPELDGRMLPSAALAALTGFLVHNLVDYSWYSLPVAGTLFLLCGAALPPAAREEFALPLPALRPARAAAALLLLLLALWLAAVLLPARYHHAQAAAARAEGRLQEALSHGRVAVARLGADADLRASLADDLSRVGTRVHLAEALRQRETSATLRPTDSTNWRRLALLQAQAGDLPAALRSAARAVEVYPTYVLGWATRARLAEQAGDAKLTTRCWSLVAQLHETPVGRYAALGDLTDPTFVPAWVHLAQQARERGDEAAVAGYYRRSAELLLRLYGLQPREWYLMARVALVGPGDVLFFRAVSDQAAQVLRDTGRPEDASLAQALLEARAGAEARSIGEYLGP